MDKIRIGILGYGNLGRGVELAVNNSADMQLVGIFTRRDKIESLSGAFTANIKDIDKYLDKIDVMILCGGSATDLPVQGCQMLSKFNTVDSFDTHAKIPEYFAKMNVVGKESGKLGIISVGWDPGLFSMARMLFGAVLPNGTDCTFWGKGVSQGHSDAIRRIDGVENAIQYTVPKQEALDACRSGQAGALTARDKHSRECCVVVKQGADKEKIRQEIISMPNYFADYDTTVNFISASELKDKHSKMPHGGKVLRLGSTGDSNNHLLEFSIKLDSNPEFTSSVLTAYARAIYKLSNEGKSGAVTVLDVPLAYLSPKSPDELRVQLL